MAYLLAVKSKLDDNRYVRPSIYIILLERDCDLKSESYNLQFKFKESYLWS